MIAAGIAWGGYSLRGKGARNPIAETAGNFLRAIPLCLILSLLAIQSFSFDSTGFWYATLSGGIASGLGYALWYAVVLHMKSSTAATVQLSVPVIAAFAGVIFLSEPLDMRLIISALAILGGISFVLTSNDAKKTKAS